MAFIQGYLFTASVNGEAINQWTSSGTLRKSTNAIPKPALGQTHNVYLNGKKDTEMSVSGHVDTAGMVILQAADDATLPIACIFRSGQLGTKDAGQYNGSGIITDLSISGDAEGEWDFDLTVQGTEEWPYTAPV